MKIAISAIGKYKKDFLDPRFGRCEYFHIIDTETGEMRVVDNLGKNASGGAGIAAAQQILDENVNVVITGQLGPNAFGVINKAGIQALTSERYTIETVLENYKRGELKDIQGAGPAHKGMGGGN